MKQTAIETLVAPPKFVNNVYEPMRAYIKEHHGWNGDELMQTELWKQYQVAMDELKSFNGKMVKVKYSTAQEWHVSSGEMTGRVRIENDRVKFYEGKHTARFRYLDLGLYDGWHATIIAKEVEAV